MTEPGPRFIVVLPWPERLFGTLPEPVTSGWKGRDLDFLKKFGLLAGALAAIVLGFVTLSLRMLTTGPLLLVLGYCVLLPFFLWRSFQKSVGE